MTLPTQHQVEARAMLTWGSLWPLDEYDKDRAHNFITLRLNWRATFYRIAGRFPDQERRTT